MAESAKRKQRRRWRLLSDPGAYLGEKYIETVFSSYHKGRISIEQAADYLDVKPRRVPGMEEWLFKQGAAA